MVTHQLQVERRTGKVCRPETDVLPLCHATNSNANSGGGVPTHSAARKLYALLLTRATLCCSAVYAVTPREKLLIGRRPVRNWTRRAISNLFLCSKLHLFAGKSTKTAATRAALFDSNIHQIVCRLRLRPRPHWGSLQRSPQTSQLYSGGLLLKGGEMR